MREARTAAALSHPNIATIYEAGEHEGTLYIAMELVEGLSLHQILQERQQFSALEAIDIARSIAAALAAAHRSGIVHRDLTPQNVMMRSTGGIKLLDFGLARMTAGSRELDVSRISVPGTPQGTPGFMPPEQILGGAVDPTVDVFAFGALVFTMLTGYPPFGNTPAQRIQNTLAGEPVSLPDIEDLPDAMTRIIAVCLSPYPHNRYSSGTELARALAEVDDISSFDASTLVRQSPRRHFRSARFGVFLGITCAAIAGLLAWWITSGP
jgi:serine/threonine-protein kinase